jgi:hypothetical protein
LKADGTTDNNVYLTSNTVSNSISSTYITYDGAIRPLDLGTFDLKVNGLTIGKGGGSIITNTAVGYQSLLSNTSGGGSVAIGNLSLFSNTSGFWNNAVGEESLNKNNTGSDNTSFGRRALFNNLDGQLNTAIGNESLFSNVSGQNNIAIGYRSLFNNMYNDNIAIGWSALYSNTSGEGNTGIGMSGLFSNTTGVKNTSLGKQALDANTTGNDNVGIGFDALDENISGSNNTSLGNNTLRTNTTGSGNTAIGYNADVASNNLTNATAIGSGAMVSTSNTIQLGNTSITDVETSGKLTASGFKIPTGTSSQYLMADGSVAEKPSLQDARGNIFTGTDALKSNITGTSNIAIGNSAMKNADPGANNTIMIGDLSGTKIIAQNNVGVGHYSLANTTNGMWNTALGMNTLTENVNGNWNAALGMYALQKNLGSRNTGIGDEALQYNTIGENNSALGHQALLSNTLGNNNTSIGMYSMHYNILGNNNVALGFQALQTNTNGSNNIAIGYNADVASNNLSNATAIGGGAIVSASNTIQLGNSSITEVKTSGVISSTKGFLPPKITSVERDAIASPQLGLIIFCYNCSVKGQMQYFDGSDWVDMVGNSAITGLNIGSTFQGGKIAYILQAGDPGYDPNRLHGIIAAISDQSTGVLWQQGIHTGSTTIFDVTDATGIAIGTGKSNTDLIIAKQTATSRPFAAAAIAISHTGGGYSDWHLPSKDELNKLYINRVAIGGFTNNWYWSSTEKNDAYAESLNFDTGLFDGLGGYKGPGGTPYYVRAIRTF